MKKILIIDDEPLMLLTLEKALSHFNASITTATCGKDALLFSGRQKFDICISDMCLPGIPGFDIIKKIREDSPQTSFIIVSAMVLDDNKKREIERSGYFFVQKPFELINIKNIVGQLLRKTQALPAAQQGASSILKYTMDKRGCIRRKPFAREISYRVSNFGVFSQAQYTYTGNLLDISEKGVGILANDPIDLGCVVRFVGLKTLNDHIAGIVRHLAAFESSAYRIGIEFV